MGLALGNGFVNRGQDVKLASRNPEGKAPRGVADILPDEQPAWEFVRSTAARVAERFGYRRIDTPVFEDTALFRRGVGEDTDIVQKEMYSFQDLGGDSLTLRPEGTASVCRLSTTSVRAMQKRSWPSRTPRFAAR